MSSDERRVFWESRLEDDWSETGVGYRALGRRFNTWIYRVRREVFLREAGALDLDWPQTRVLDVGSGTGFYVQAWRDLGAGSVTGCDLTQAAVDRLRTRFPNVRFHRLDIAEPGDLLAADWVFDVASCMDVLFHITDDARYVAALESIGGALRPGGHFVLSENFVHRDVERGPNQTNRTLDWITEATGWLAGAALYPLERRLVRNRRESPTTEIMACRRR